VAFWSGIGCVDLGPVHCDVPPTGLLLQTIGTSLH